MHPTSRIARSALLRRQPSLDDCEHVRRLLVRQLVSLGDAVRLFQAAAATRRGGVLRHEDGMIAPRSLTAVVLRLSGGEALREERRGLLHHVRQAPLLQVGELASGEAKLPPERRLG